jgi:hypothetical protein
MDCNTLSDAIFKNHTQCFQNIHQQQNFIPLLTNILLQYCKTQFDNDTLWKYILTHRSTDPAQRLSPSIQLIPLLLAQNNKDKSLEVYYVCCPEDCSTLLSALIMHEKPYLLKKFHEKGCKFTDSHLCEAILLGRWDIAEYIWLQTKTNIQVICRALNQMYVENEDCVSYLDRTFWRERLFPLSMSFLLPYFFLYEAIKHKKECILAYVEYCKEHIPLSKDIKQYILYEYF